jgi:putative flippase GtrA
MVYIMLTGSGWRASLAGAVGYCIGMMTHFCLSTRFVFDTEGTQKSESRLVLEFAASGMAGLAITAFIIALTTELLGLGVLTAKAIAVVASFLAVYFVRRALVFAKPSSQT